MNKRLTQNIHEILILVSLIITRFYKIGLEFVHNDAFHIKFWSFEFYNHFLNAQFSEMFKIIQPGVLTVWINIFSWKILDLLGKLNIFVPAEGKEYELYLQIFQKGAKSVVIVALIFVIYIQLKKLFGQKVAFLSAIFITFEPFLITNHRIMQTDGLMSLLLFLSLLFFVQFLQNKNYKTLILVGCLLGASFVEKSTAIITLPFFGLVYLIDLTFLKKNFNFKKALFVLGVGVLSFVITAVVLFPSYWGAPIYTLQRMTYDIFVLGIKGIEVEETYQATKHIREWHYYLLTLIVRTTPFLKISVILFFFSKLKFKKEYLYLILFIIYFIVIHQLGEKQIDRYMVTPITIFTVIASAGVIEFAKRLKLKLNLVILSILILSFINFFALSLHFNQYYDPFTRSLFTINKGVFNDAKNLGGYTDASYYISNNYGNDIVIASSDYKMLYLYYRGVVVPEEQAYKNNAKFLVNGCGAKQGVLEKEQDIYFNNICLLTIYKL